MWTRFSPTTSVSLRYGSWETFSPWNGMTPVVEESL